MNKEDLKTILILSSMVVIAIVIGNIFTPGELGTGITKSIIGMGR